MTDPTTVLASARTLPIRIFGTGLLALALFVGVKGAAAAPAVCGDHVEFLDKLATGSAEGPKAIGMIADGGVLELLTSKAGTWTIIVTRPTGESCIVATGKAWEILGKPTPGQPV